MTNFSIDSMIFVVILLINFVVGLKASKGIKTIQEYALGGRNFSTAALVATITATWISGSYFFTTISETYSNGLYYVWSMVGGDIVSFLLVALLFAPRMGEFLGKLSIAEAMGGLYGNKVRIITAITGSIVAAGIIASQLKVTGMLSGYLFDMPPMVGIIIGGAIITTYSALGGIKSVTFTDMVQFFTFGTIIPALGIFLFTNIADGSKFTSTLSNYEMFDLSVIFDFTQAKSLYYLFLFFFIAIPGFDPASFQRISMAKDTRQVAKSFLNSIFFCVLLVLMMSWIGFLLMTLHPGMDANLSFQYILKDFSMIGFKGLVISGIMSMVMSTVDSSMNSTSIILVHDLLRPIGFQIKDELKASRIASVLLGISAVTMAIKSDTLLKLLITTYSFYMPIVTVPFMFSILGFRSSSKSVLIGMAAGFITVCFWEIFMRNHTVDSVIPGMIVSTIFLFGSHYLLKQPGGWVGIKDNSELKRIKRERKEIKARLVYNIKNFDLINFCVNNKPKHAMTYVCMAIFSLILIFSNVYFLDINVRYQNKILLDNLYVTVLAFSTIFLTYPIWPARFQNKKFISVTWMLGLFYVLTFVSGLGVLISKFNEFHLMLLLLSLVTLAMLTRWQITILFMSVGLSSSVLFFKIYTDFAPINFNVGTLQFKALYILLMLSSMLLAFFKPKQDELDEAQTVKARFMKNFNHEIRAPLHNIFMSTELLKDNYGRMEESKRLEFVDNIYISNNRLYALMSNMLDLAALEQGDLRCHLEDNQDLVAAVKDAIANYQTNSINKNQKIILHCDHKKIIAKLDYVKIVQAFGNLLSNAIRYSPEDSEIHVSIRLEDGYAICEVKDYGCGIDDEEIEHIFEPFTESKKTASNAGGTGIGLTFVRYIADGHNAKLKCENNKYPENGVTFTIYIPVYEQQAQLMEGSSEQEPKDDSKDNSASSFKRPKLIVLAEDNVLVRQSEEMTLIDLGYEFVSFEDGAEALEYIEANSDKVDLVITDIMMPIMGGEELIRHIRNNPNMAHIRIGIQSGETHEFEKYMAQGANAYMAKPYNKNSINELIHNSCS